MKAINFPETIFKVVSPNMKTRMEPILTNAADQRSLSDLFGMKIPVVNTAV